MTIAEYLDSIKWHLLTDPLISHFHIVRDTYSYHWADTEGRLIRRWDNTPHFPNLPGFPHHVHNGRAATVSPGQPVNVFTVLDEIAWHLQTGDGNG